MKTPPLLLGAALLFWGWQTGYLAAGAAMAAVLESPRWIKARWDFADEDYRRIWVFCALLFLGVAVFVFTSNGGFNDLRDFLDNPNLAVQRTSSAASARAVAVWLRSAPLAFFLFIAAQSFSAGEGIPPETISLLLRLRWQKARKLGRPAPPPHSINVSYPYFLVCLFAASFRAREDDTFFWGLCVLVGWSMWSSRSRRFGLVVWSCALALAIGVGYAGGRGVGRLYRFLEDYNVSWFSRGAGGGADPLMSKTAIGRIGLMKGSSRIVVRVEPKDGGVPPPLLREASYRTYKVEVWYSETAKDRSEPVIASDPNHTTWPLLPEKTNTSAVTIGCYLSGRTPLIPLPTGCARLENLSAFSLEKNLLGAVTVQGPGLVVFDALYGPGETIDAPPDEVDYRGVPRLETNALDQVIAELHLKPNDRKLAVRTLTKFFDEKFRYRTWQGFEKTFRTNDTPLSRFLLRDRSGHCEYFATATVLLLRRLGIPARYAVGYAVHEGAGGKYVVRNRDAHAWCLVWNENLHTWQDLDTTPSVWVEAEAKRRSPMQAWSDFWERIGFEFSKFRWGQTHLRRYIILGLCPILALLLYQIVFHRRRRSAGAEGGSAVTAWPGLDSEFYQIEQALAQRGVHRDSSEPLSQWLLALMGDPELSKVRDTLGRLLRLHYRYRFDPRGLSLEEREALRREAQSCLSSLRILRVS